ncbi:MAG: hypothetical protein ACR2IH_05680, partial [Pyrinomonadaceae bacterium]
IRQWWYRHDDLFAANEEAINIVGIREEFKDRFSVTSEIYSGNVGYLFVLNSMVFRIPVSIKKLYSPLFLRLEAFFERYQSPLFSCMAQAQWRKI